MISINTVFQLHFPVRIESVIRAPGDHLRPVGRLVDNHVQKKTDAIQIIHQWFNIRVKRAKQKAPVIFEMGNFGQAVGLVIKSLGVTTLLLILDQFILSSRIKGPAVVRANMEFFVARFVLANQRGLMWADVQKGP